MSDIMEMIELKEAMNQKVVTSDRDRTTHYLLFSDKNNIR